MLKIEEVDRCSMKEVIEALSSMKWIIKYFYFKSENILLFIICDKILIVLSFYCLIFENAN